MRLVDINDRFSVMQIALASMNQILSPLILPPVISKNDKHKTEIVTFQSSVQKKYYYGKTNNMLISSLEIYYISSFYHLSVLTLLTADIRKVICTVHK